MAHLYSWDGACLKTLRERIAVFPHLVSEATKAPLKKSGHEL